MKTTITVVIPVYNCEKYLRKCIDSVVNQTLKNIEIILINDCSSDGSQRIIETYSRDDSRIISIELENNVGVSAARNAGLDRANGDYIIFLDSDDCWLDNTMLETLSETARRNTADIVNFGLRLLSPEGKQLLVSVDEDQVVGLKQNNDWHFNYSPVSNLLSKKLIEEHGIRFDPLLVMGEDALFNITFFCYASRLVVIKKVYYNYQIRTSSANTSCWSKHKLTCTVLWFERAIQVIRNSPAFERHPRLLQELIHERLGMLTRKLAVMALVIFNRNELREYVDLWAECFTHLDSDFFDKQYFPTGWPALHRNTVDMIINKDLEGLSALYSSQPVPAGH